MTRNFGIDIVQTFSMLEGQKCFVCKVNGSVVIRPIMYRTIDKTCYIGRLILGHHIFHMIHPNSYTIMIREKITQTQIGLWNRHFSWINIIDMPTFGFIVSAHIRYRKTIIFTGKSNIRFAIGFSVSSPRDKELSFIVSSVSYRSVFLCKSNCCRY